MTFKTGSSWKACFDDTNGRYFCEYGGTMAYDLYEITKEQFDRITEGMTEYEIYKIVDGGRHLFMSADDRCGPPYSIAFDDDYEKLCPWAKVMKAGRTWSEELTDAAVEIFASEENNREQRRKKREERQKKQKEQQQRRSCPMQFICYPKCTTCQKAKKWLDANGVAYDERHIKDEKPTLAELKAWHKQSGLPLKKFFNTSGLQYKELHLKDKLPTMSEEEQFKLLASDGMLVKRPLLVGDGFVLVGFKEEEWKARV